MEFSCSSCGKIYNIDPSKIPQGKKAAKCKICGGIVSLEIEIRKNELPQAIQQKCNKCGYERNSSDSAPDGQCPKCGVIYAKIAKRISAEENSESKNKIKSKKQANNFRKYIPKEKIAILYICAALFLGIFIGREHLKYEMRNAFAEGLKNISQGFNNDYKSLKEKNAKFGIDSKRKEEPKKEESENIKTLPVKLIQKNYEEDKFSPNISITLVFTNVLNNDIRAFQGFVIFMDILGNNIMRVKLKNQDIIKDGETFTWKGSVNYNQFIDGHRELKHTPLNDIRIKFNLKKVIYTDGTEENL
jgi:predicted  nucleic acid-binding Zn-ribbon protein